VLDPKKRFTVTQIRRHRWMQVLKRPETDPSSAVTASPSSKSTDAGDVTPSAAGPFAAGAGCEPVKIPTCQDAQQQQQQQQQQQPTNSQQQVELLDEQILKLMHTLGIEPCKTIEVRTMGYDGLFMSLVIAA